MRQPLALAMALAIVAIPACAQRGGGFSAPRASISSHVTPVAASHSGPAFHSNFGTGAPYRPMGGRLPGNRPGGSAIPFRTSGTVYRAPSAFRVSPGSRWPPFYSRNREGRRPHYGYGIGIPYEYPLWLGPSYFDDTADSADDAGEVAPDAEDYAEVQPDLPPPMDFGAVASAAPPAPADSEAVTLIFKDGRPPLQVRNYALTRTTLYVVGEHHRDIPVADLDLAATERVNREAGVTFQLPGFAQ